MQTVIFIVIAVVVVLFGYAFAMQRLQLLNTHDEVGERGAANKKRADERKERLRKVQELFNQKEKVTNNDVEQALDVSDSTAENYLNALEIAGKIRQVGKTGTSVYYEKIV